MKRIKDFTFAHEGIHPGNIENSSVKTKGLPNKHISFKSISKMLTAQSIPRRCGTCIGSNGLNDSNNAQASFVPCEMCDELPHLKPYKGESND